MVFNSATWTGPLLIEWIKREYNISYKKAQIYNILKKLGLTYQKRQRHFILKRQRGQKRWRL